MKNARTILPIVVQLTVGFAFACAPPMAACGLLTACTSDRDPETWVKRLDEPDRRAEAVKRLGQLFDDAMSKAEGNREAPEVKALVDELLEPLSRHYLAGDLDDESKSAVVKVLASTRDPRAFPVFAKVLTEIDPKKNATDPAVAAKAIREISESGKPVPQTVADALWTGFSKLHAFDTDLGDILRELHDALITVKSPSYGPKCLEKLDEPVDEKVPEQYRDKILFWQPVCIDLVREMKFAPAARSLVRILVTKSKVDLDPQVYSALLAIPTAVEKPLVAAFAGEDPEFAPLQQQWDARGYLVPLAEGTGWLARPLGRDAAIAVVAVAGSDQNRARIASTLSRYPANMAVTAAFRSAYAAIPAGARAGVTTGDNLHQALLTTVPNFFDDTFVDWVLKVAEVKAEKEEIIHTALTVAMKVMIPAQIAVVSAAVAKDGGDKDKAYLSAAVAVMQKCDTDAACYVKVLDEPVSEKSEATGHVKAVFMAAIYGNTATRRELAQRVTTSKRPEVRFILAQAVLHMAPEGDVPDAEALEAAVRADGAKAALIPVDKEVSKIALMLRSRAAK